MPVILCGVTYENVQFESWMYVHVTERTDFCHMCASQQIHKYLCYTDFHPAVCNTGLLLLVPFDTVMLCGVLS